MDLSSLETVTRTGNWYTRFNVIGGTLDLGSPTVAPQAFDHVVFKATEGASINLAGPTGGSYSSKGLYTNWGVRYYEKSHTYDLITASGEGSTVDLSSLTTFDASFNSPTYNYTTQRVVATGGGFVNLSVSVQPSATTDGGRGGSLPVTT